MTALPLPFVAAMTLAVLLALLLRRSGGRIDPAAGAFLSLALVQSIVLGLRWLDGGDAWVRFVQPIGAAALPGLAWWMVRRLGGHADRHGYRPAILAAVVVTVVAIFRRGGLDILLPALFAAYGVAILVVAARGPDRLTRVRFASARLVQAGVAALGASFLVSAAVDGAIAVFGVAAARPLLVAGNAVTILYAAAAIVLLGGAGPDAVGAEPRDDVREASEGGAPAAAAAVDDVETRRIFALVEQAMAERGLHRDPDLTLDRLARRLGLPARRISEAINRTSGENVSHYVNRHRIEAAKRLIAGTDRPITEVMFEAGFQTKSNFNREFKRLTGQSPSEWRAAVRSGPDGDGTPG